MDCDDVLLRRPPHPLQAPRTVDTYTSAVVMKKNNVNVNGRRPGDAPNKEEDAFNGRQL